MNLNATIRRCEIAIETLVVGAVFVSTVAFGGMHPFGLASALIPLLLAFCLWAVLCVWGGTPPGQAHVATPSQPQMPGNACLPPLPVPSRLVLVMLPFCAAYIIIQTVPLPVSWVSRLSSHAAAIQMHVREGLSQGPPRWLTLAVNAGYSRQALFKCLIAMLGFWAGLYLASQRRRGKRVLFALILIEMLEAAYGLAENLSGHDHVLWTQRGHEASGTLINRNNFAALMAMFIPITIGWFLYLADQPVPVGRHGYYRRAGLWEVLSSRRGLWLLAPAAMLLGVIQSASRGGLVSMVIGLLLFFALSARRRLNRTVAWLAALVALVLIAYAMNSQYQLVLGRLKEMTAQDYVEGRIIIWRDSLPMLRDFRLFGVGMGNFGGVFKRYTSMETIYYIEQAHNEWLEILLTMGLVGAPLFYLLFVGWVRGMVRNIRRASRRDQLWMRGVLCGLTGLAVHCVTEFNFHITALSLTAFLLVGLLTGYAPRSEHDLISANGDKGAWK